MEHNPDEHSLKCPKCHHGMVTDAGEFTDLKDESRLDWFRTLIKGNRDRITP
jgi:hypothetical protein